ncbi:MAG: polyprenol monophosphomannose synthase [Ktedonobacterales bacterium]
MKSLIVIPTYNERENIVGLIEDILRVAPATDILIIDDNSPDGTGRIADDLHTQRRQVSVLHRAGKLGLGTAYIRGFEYAIEHGYDFVFEMDADYSHDPRYLPDFFAKTDDADLVIGSRYVAGGGTPNWSALRKLISGGGNTFARGVLRIPVHDCTAGFRCYRTSALSTLDLERIRAQGYAFQVEMAYIFWKRGFRIRETPIIFVDRRVGKSKMSRKIFIEGFVWVLRTRIFGDAVVKSAPRMTATSTRQPTADAAKESATSRPLS